MTIHQISFNYLEPLPLSKQEKIRHHRALMKIYDDHTSRVANDFKASVGEKPKMVSRRERIRKILRGQEKYA